MPVAYPKSAWILKLLLCNMRFGKSEVTALRERIFAPRRRMRAPMHCLHRYSLEISDLFSDLFNNFSKEYGYNQDLCLIATGGYGRGELFPFSDIDLLILYKRDSFSDMIGAFERAAWDTGLSLGMVARTLDQCTRILGDDYATDTALLESTFVAGDFALYTRFIERTLRPYFSRNRRKFIQEIRSALVQGIDSAVDTLYRIEPDVKNGICCLRDCQRIVWAERIAQGILGGKTLPDFHFINPHDRRILIQSYTFLAKIRIELHIISKRRLDVLEIDLQKDIARSFGYENGSPEPLMGDFYRTVTTIRHSILSFVERVRRARITAGKVRSVFASFDAGNGLFCIDGILHIRNTLAPVRIDAEWILDVCSTVLTCHAEPGIDVRNSLREMARQLLSSNFRTASCERKFCTILADTRRVGRVIQLMHETGVLELIVPEFAPLTCRVEFDTYHEYTVDQHTLLALRAFDELHHEKDERVRDAYSSISNRRVFRLALLLHDAGKVYGSDHCRDGAIVARNAAVRLGFDEKEQEQVALLVYHHLDMSELSLRRALEEDMLQQFATTVESSEMLDMLYLLTILDIRYVGSHTMTGWKHAQLTEIYTITRKVLSEGGRFISAFTRYRSIGNYRAMVFPEDLSIHQQWLDKLSEMEMQLHIESFTGFYRVTIVTHDRLSLLTDIASCFIVAGLQIVSANIYSLDNGNVIDIFDVEAGPETVMTIEERQQQFNKAWDSIQDGRMTSSGLVKKKLDVYPRKTTRQLQVETAVTINNRDSRQYTIIEVRTSDRFGLFYTLVSILGTHKFNIIAARIATSIDVAVDVFYICDDNGNKITDCQCIKSLQRMIVKVLE